MPFACIYVPNFPVAAILRAEPELRSQAIAVLVGKPPLEKVFGVNEKARQLGIETGMSKNEVEICDEIALRSRSLLQESEAHTALLNCAQAFSPCVEDTADDTLLLDLGGLDLLFGSLPKIGQGLAQQVSHCGLQANVALAANSDTALLAARGFSGITLISPEKEAERLGGLPLEVLFRDASESETLLETLHRWGVRNLRALAALPEVALSERLGQEGLRLQRLARGAASRTLVPVDPPLAFEEEIELEHPLVLLEPLAFALNRMLEQICGRLASHALAVQELNLELELEPNPEQAFPDHAEAGVHVRPCRAVARQFTRTLRLPVPLLDAKVFLKLLQLDLKAHPPGAPIVKIHLTAQPAQPRAAQGGLFLPPTPEPEKLELTMARIAGIVGEHRVGSLEILDTHHPEGFRMQHFAPGEPQGVQRVRESSNFKAMVEKRLFPAAKRRKNEAHGASHGSNGEMSQPRSGERQAALYQEPSAAWLKPCPDTKQAQESDGNCAVTALRVFRPALRAAVSLRDGQPAHIACPKRKEVQGNVIWMAGPWRSSGDWWEQEGWRRDEWDIALQNESGIALYRLVRDLLRGVWLVEGAYD